MERGIQWVNRYDVSYNSDTRMEEIDVLYDVMTRKTFYITDPLWGNPPVNHLTKGQKCGALVFPFV